MQLTHHLLLALTSQARQGLEQHQLDKNLVNAVNQGAAIVQAFMAVGGVQQSAKSNVGGLRVSALNMSVRARMHWPALQA